MEVFSLLTFTLLNTSLLGGRINFHPLFSCLCLLYLTFGKPYLMTTFAIVQTKLQKVFILNETPSIAQHFLAEIRDVQVQHDRLRFRRNMERLGELLAYEISKSLDYTSKAIHTPLDEIKVGTLAQPPVLVSILRAGIPFHQGFLNYFDQAENGFIGAYRKHENQEAAFTIAMDYQAIPSVDDRTLILIDPMLATGRSVVAAVQALLNYGTPKQLHIAAAIAAPEGVAHLAQNTPVDYSLWIGALDEKLNDKFYIVPGLGDAGDLAFGPKL